MKHAALEKRRNTDDGITVTHHQQVKLAVRAKGVPPGNEPLIGERDGVARTTFEQRALRRFESLPTDATGDLFDTQHEFALNSPAALPLNRPALPEFQS